MSTPFAGPEDYELFLYNLAEQFSSIRYSTVTFVRRGATLARVAGEICFDKGFRLVVRERLTYSHLPMVLDGYGYEVWCGDVKLYWYDCQPHPAEPSLESTFPHHKRVPPDIKQHRVPAVAMSFSRPNLPALIHEIEELIGAG